MNTPNPICPSCKDRKKAANCGYCAICNRAKVAQRYRKSRAGKSKGTGWRGKPFALGARS